MARVLLCQLADRAPSIGDDLEVMAAWEDWTVVERSSRPPQRSKRSSRKELEMLDALDKLDKEQYKRERKERKTDGVQERNCQGRQKPAIYKGVFVKTNNSGFDCAEQRSKYSQ